MHSIEKIIQEWQRTEFPYNLDGKISSARFMYLSARDRGVVYLTIESDKVAFYCPQEKRRLNLNGWIRVEYPNNPADRARTLFDMYKSAEEKGHAILTSEKDESNEEMLVIYSPSTRGKKIY